jgi:Flp pilus assembly protein TadD
MTAVKQHKLERFAEHGTASQPRRSMVGAAGHHRRSVPAWRLQPDGRAVLKDERPERGEDERGRGGNRDIQMGDRLRQEPARSQKGHGLRRGAQDDRSKDRALEVLKTAYRADPSNGEVAAELGRAVLDAGRVDVASHALKSAESQGVTDWKTLSAQSTLHARKGEHELALSYALDGKAEESEHLLRQAAASGHDDKRICQNSALVLGIQGKFSEPREVAFVDMTEAQAKSSMSYLRNMLAKPTQVAVALRPKISTRS